MTNTYHAAYWSDLSYSSSEDDESRYNKCNNILHIGSQTNLTFTLLCSLPIQWSDCDVDILVIQIPKEINDLTTIPFNRKLAKIDKILLPWKGKYLYLWKNHPG